MAYRIYCHIKGTDKNCNTSSEGLREIIPGHKDQESFRNICLRALWNWDDWDLRAMKLTGRLLGLRYRLNLNAQQWERKARCLKPNPVGIMVSGWDMSGMGKEQIKDDKGSPSNLYFQTSRNLSLGSRISDSTLKIQNNLTIAGGNAQ